MSADKQVLVVDLPNGMLSGVMEELDELGFRVVWVPTLSAALDFMNASPKLSLIVASSAATQFGGLEFLAQVQAVAPHVRMIWGAPVDELDVPHTRRGPGLGPNGLISEPFRSDQLRTAISELLAEHFYPPAIATALQIAALEVLRCAGQFEVEGGAFLVANQTALCDVSAVIPFTGGVSGHLMLGMTNEHATLLHQTLLPSQHPVRVDRMEDLVGELCNQILGRINAFFAEHAVSILHGTPIFIRAPGGTLRYPGRQPSFALTLVRSHSGARVSIEYYLADFDGDKLQPPVANRVLPLNEVRYF